PRTAQQAIPRISNSTSRAVETAGWSSTIRTSSAGISLVISRDRHVPGWPASASPRTGRDGTRVDEPAVLVGRLAGQALVVVDLHRPDLADEALAPVSPGGEEGPRDPRQAVVVAELKVAPGGVGGAARHRGQLDGSAPGGAFVEGRGVPEVDEGAVLAHRVVVDEAEAARRLVDHHPGIELVVERGRV